jgi:putative endonuclease
MEGFYIYALVSERDGVIYVGIANNCERRLNEHNSGKSQYTKGHTPWRLFYSEFVGDVMSARSKEKYFKTSAGKRRLRAILKSI